MTRTSRTTGDRLDVMAGKRVPFDQDARDSETSRSWPTRLLPICCASNASHRLATLRHPETGHRSRSGSRASRAGPIRPASCFCVCATSLLDAALSFDAKCPFGFSTGYPAASLVNLADPYPIGGLAMLLVSSKHRCHRSRVRGCTRLRLMWPSSYARSIARRRKQRRARRSW
jgi:hypothetical protein